MNRTGKTFGTWLKNQTWIFSIEKSTKVENKGIQRLLSEIPEISPNLGKEMDIHMWEAFRTPKILREQKKRKNINSSMREITYKGNPTRIAKISQ
jgi:hypothetical protein